MLLFPEKIRKNRLFKFYVEKAKLKYVIKYQQTYAIICLFGFKNKKKVEIKTEK